MFAKLFKKSSEFQLNGNENQNAWAISANEKTVVVWTKMDKVTIITTYDYDENRWIHKTQEFEVPLVQQAYKIHLSEDGNILIHYGNDRIDISTWQRSHRNGNWIQKNRTVYRPNNNPTTNNVYIAFHNNNIFAGHQDNLTIISRATSQFKMVRKQRTLYNDYLQCFTFGYDYNHLAQVTDGVFYYWEQQKDGSWDRILPSWYDGEVMPYYAAYQQNEAKAFIPGSVWIIQFPERTSYEFKNEKIKEKQTQSALNYFFQNEKQKSIDFWYRENQGIREFHTESLEIEAVDILLGLSGKVFLVQQKTKEGIKIQFYERQEQ